MSEQLSFSGALYPDLLIGRDEQLAAIEHAVSADIGAAFRCVLLRADGGLGKTRLLNEVCARLGTPTQSWFRVAVPPTPWAYPATIALPLIDVADPYLHTLVPFLREVRRGFGIVLGNSQAAARFAQFDEALDRYQQARDGEQPLSEMSAIIKQVSETFFGEYAELTASMRVVWPIDTLEQLFVIQSEIEELFAKASLLPSSSERDTFQWLLNFVASHPANTTLVMAGRKEPSPWAVRITDAVNLTTGVRFGADGSTVTPIEAPLIGLQPDSPAPNDERARLQLGVPVDLVDAGLVVSFELEPFSAQQTREYVDAIKQKLEATTAYAHLAGYLQHNILETPEQLQLFVQLTQGNPISLSIYLDLLLNSPRDPEIFARRASDLLQEIAQDTERTGQLQQGVRGAFLPYLIRNSGVPAYGVLELLGLTRRGLDRERLKQIWSNDDKAIDDAYETLLQLSFVKYRADPVDDASSADDPPSGRLFLHDELYGIYQKGLIERGLDVEDRAAQHRLFEGLIAFFDERFRACVDELTRLKAELKQLRERYEIGTPEYAEEYQRLNQLMRRLRHERRQLRAEEVHYKLYLDPETGFYDWFFRRSEQALVAQALEHDAQFQSELALYFFGNTADLNRQQADYSLERWNVLRFAVIYEQVSSWIKRLTAFGNLDEAQRLAVEAEARYADIIIRQPQYDWLKDVRELPQARLLRYLFELEWKANGAFAALLQGQRLEQTIEDIQRVVELLEAVFKKLPISNVPTETELPKACSWRFENLRAQCLLYIGYGYAQLYRFQQARGYYEQADAILAETGFQSLKAEVRNDWSRVLGELGDLSEAQIYCQEGIAIRMARGFDSLLAYSYNTMALIHTRNGLPIKASVWAEEARTLFHQLNHQRGTGLALVQLAEALRRGWNLKLEEAALLGTVPSKQDKQDTSQLHAARTHLYEAVRIFAQRSEVGRLIEALHELGCLLRDWAAVLGEEPLHQPIILPPALTPEDTIALLDPHEEATPSFELALACLDMALALAQKHNYQEISLAAIVNKAWLFSKRQGQEQQARAALVEAHALISHVESQESGEDHQLNTERHLNVPAGNFNESFFRELSKMHALEAELAGRGETPDTDAVLEHLLLATTYIQLFSPYDTPYMLLNRRKLARLVSRLRAEGRLTPDALRAKLDNVIEKYFLRHLNPYFERKEFKLSPRSGLIVEELIWR